MTTTLIKKRVCWSVEHGMNISRDVCSYDNDFSAEAVAYLDLSTRDFISIGSVIVIIIS